LTLYIDVNADGLVTAGDALDVINDLNAASAGVGEGEASVGQASATIVSANLSAANTSLVTIGDVLLSGPVERVTAKSGSAGNVLPSGAADQAYRPENWARVSPGSAADEAQTLFDDLDADHPGVEDALTDILRELGSAAGCEAATDALFGRLFG